MKLLLVEDDQKIALAVQRGLVAEGFSVEIAVDGNDGLWRATEGSYDLIVLDIMLPGASGLDFLRAAGGERVPVILLTARVEEADRVLGLELGADDYVSKPFSPRELVARVRTVLRRAQHTPTSTAAPVQFDGLRIDVPAREVFVNDELVVLTAKEFDLLAFLAQAPRQVFSRAQLLHHVWDSSPDFQDPATVTVHVRRLRNKIEANPEQARWITTVWGVGYRFEP